MDPYIGIVAPSQDVDPRVAASAVHALRHLDSLVGDCVL